MAACCLCGQGGGGRGNGPEDQGWASPLLQRGWIWRNRTCERVETPVRPYLFLHKATSLDSASLIILFLLPFICAKPSFSQGIQFDSTYFWEDGASARVGNDPPGCKVESTTFFACHSSGVIPLRLPSLYSATSLFAFSSPALETKRVLIPLIWPQLSVNYIKRWRLWLTGHWEFVDLQVSNPTPSDYPGDSPHLGSAISADWRTRPQ